MSPRCVKYCSELHLSPSSPSLLPRVGNKEQKDTAYSLQTPSPLPSSSILPMTPLSRIAMRTRNLKRQESSVSMMLPENPDFMIPILDDCDETSSSLDVGYNNSSDDKEELGQISSSFRPRPVCHPFLRPRTI